MCAVVTRPGLTAAIGERRVSDYCEGPGLAFQVHSPTCGWKYNLIVEPTLC